MPPAKKNNPNDHAVLSYAASGPVSRHLHQFAVEIVDLLMSEGLTPYEAHLFIAYLLVEFYGSVEPVISPEQMAKMKELHIKTIQNDFEAAVQEAEENNYTIIDQREEGSSNE